MQPFRIDVHSHPMFPDLIPADGLHAPSPARPPLGDAGTLLAFRATPSGASGNSSPPTSGTGTRASHTSRPSAGSPGGASTEASPSNQVEPMVVAAYVEELTRSSSRRRASSSTSRRSEYSSIGSSSAKSSPSTPRGRSEGPGMSSRPARPRSSPRRKGPPHWQSFAPPRRDRPAATSGLTCHRRMHLRDLRRHRLEPTRSRHSRLQSALTLFGGD